MVDERGAQARTHGAGVTGAIECRYYGRDFTAGEMALLRALIAGPPPLNRHMLSKDPDFSRGVFEALDLRVIGLI